MKILREKSREIILLAVIVIICAVTSLISPNFMTARNINNLLSNNAIYGIMAIGMMLVISTGNIDVSAGQMLAACTVLVAHMVRNLHFLNPVIIFILAIIMGSIIGLINGVLIAKVGIPSIIVTLGTTSVMRGGLLLIFGSNWITDLPSWFNGIGQIKLLGININIVIWLIICLLTYLMMKYTIFGRNILAVGGNRIGALRIGVSVDKITIFAFCFIGATVGLTSVVYTAQLGFAQPVTGVGYEMTLIAATVIGGTRFEGGKSSILGTVLGVLLLGVMENVLVLLRVPVHWQELVIGVVIILSIASSALRLHGEKRKLAGGVR